MATLSEMLRQYPSRLANLDAALAECAKPLPREHVEHLTAVTVAGSVNLLTALRDRIGPDPDHTDIEDMLRAWHAGPAGRALALEMAENHRRRAMGAQTIEAAA